MGLNVLVIGNGGREHAIVWKLRQSKTVNKIFVAPGNGGTANIDNVINVNDLSGSPQHFDRLQQFAKENHIGLVVPGPEQPLVDGISSVFNSIGIPVFGPSAKAAIMEGSKGFSKRFMEKHNIPTAKYKTFRSVEDAKKHIDEIDYKVVLKADGIAGGKGVLIPESKQEALQGLKELMVDKNFGTAGDEVVIEEYLDGDELSILTITDGYLFFNFPTSQDHKRIGDGDEGLNTGGMGAYAPAPLATETVLKKINDNILRPTIDGMRQDGFPMCGILFTGIMLSPQGEPKVLEYNVRFGDPETQTVLPLLSDDSDLAEIMLACAEHRLDSVKLQIQPNMFSTTVVMAAGGYPEHYSTGDEIDIKQPLPKNTYIFHAGTTIKGTKVVTAGGRVIAATAIASTLKESVAKAYSGVDHISFRNKYNRKDIAHKAFRGSANKTGVTYAEAGVSVDNGNLLVEQIKAKVKSTARPGADSDIGGFGGLFDLSKAGYDSKNVMLVGATDGVGTKLRVAQIMDIHNTVGIDLVAMNVNDLIVQGAEPLMFLDYFATAKLDVNIAKDFVAGVADGCIQAGCALVGGETSEMPGMYEPGHYDTNGTAIGAVDKHKMLPRLDEMQSGNILIGLKSNGVHSNGFSLVRHLIETSQDFTYTSPAPFSTSGKTIGEEILEPTKIYVKQLLPVINKDLLLGLAHITGGGLVENIPRALPSHLQARIDANNWQIPEIFKWFGKLGSIPYRDILKTFNLGIGMVLIVELSKVDDTLEILKSNNEDPVVIGYLQPKLKLSDSGCIVDNIDGIY